MFLILRNIFLILIRLLKDDTNTYTIHMQIKTTNNTMKMTRRYQHIKRNKL